MYNNRAIFIIQQILITYVWTSNTKYVKMMYVARKKQEWNKTDRENNIQFVKIDQ